MMKLFKKYDGDADTKMPLCQQRHQAVDKPAGVGDD